MWTITDTNVPVCSATGRSYGSSYNPRRAAERWLAAEREKCTITPGVIAIIGIGAGHHLRVVAEQYPEHDTVALEPDAELWAATAAVRSETLRGLAIACYGGAELTEQLLGTIVHRAGGVGNIWLLVYPAARTFYPAAVQTLLQRLAGVLAQDVTSLRTGMVFAWEWLEHVLANLPVLLESSAAQHLQLRPAGCPAIVVGAAPSLDRVLAEVRQVRERAMIIACDTALRPLMESGTVPDLIISVDSQHANLDHFCGITQEIPVVYDPIVDPGLWEWCGGRRIVGNTGSPVLDFLEANLGRLSAWAAGGAVASIAYQVARQGGSSPLLFAGVDYQCTDNRRHARGTKTHREAVAATTRFSPLETIEGQSVRETELSAAVFGTPLLQQYADWLNLRIAEDGTEAYRASAHGRLTLPVRPLTALRDMPVVQKEIAAAPVPWQRTELVRILVTAQRLTRDWQRELVPLPGPQAIAALAREPFGGVVAALVEHEKRAVVAGMAGTEAQWRAAFTEILERLAQQLTVALEKLQ